MKFVLFSLVVLAIVQGAVLPKNGFRREIKHPSVNHSGKIYNGIQASPGQFPYMVAIFPDNSAPYGGSLVNPRWILTAASCVKDHIIFVNYLGSVNLGASEEGRLVEVSHNAIYHESFIEATHLNDIALIQLDTEVTSTIYIRPISLPSRTNIGNTYEGDELTVSGWGETSDEYTQTEGWLLYAVEVVIINAVCESTYGYIPPTAMCTAGQFSNICQGDQGDPLVDYYNNVQVGVASYAASTGCGGGSPTVYSRLTTYLEWISRNTGIPIA